MSYETHLLYFLNSSDISDLYFVSFSRPGCSVCFSIARGCALSVFSGTSQPASEAKRSEVITKADYFYSSLLFYFR